MFCLVTYILTQLISYEFILCCTCYDKLSKKKSSLVSYSCRKYKMSLSNFLCFLIPVAKLLLRPCSFFESFWRILLHLYQRQNAYKTAWNAGFLNLHLLYQRYSFDVRSPWKLVDYFYFFYAIASITKYAKITD